MHEGVVGHPPFAVMPMGESLLGEVLEFLSVDATVLEPQNSLVQIQIVVALLRADHLVDFLP